MWNLIPAPKKLVFSDGRILKLVKSSVNVTDSTNTVLLTKISYEL